MNKVILMGRLTRDIDIRYSQYSQGEKPMAIAKGTLAVDRRRAKEGEQSADFINISAFGKIAEFLEKFGNQGTKFLVEGRIQTGSYINKDGQKVYTTEVVLENIEFAEGKRDNSAAPQAPTAPETGAGDGFMNIPEGVDEEGLPFN